VKFHSLIREISLALVLKLAALTAIFYLYFGPADRMVVNGDVVARHLLWKDASHRGIQP
jgi:hypothetical protein